MEYFVWLSDQGDDFCAIKEPALDEKWQLADGIPRVATLAGPVPCQMSPNHPKAVRLSDNLYGATVPVVSARIKAALEKVVIDRVEYLPAEVINHKGRMEKAEYFVLHPLDMVDCIDLKASEVEWNSITPDKISGCEQLVLKKKAIGKDQRLFRLKQWGRVILVRDDLAESLEAAGFTGLLFMPSQEYTGIE